MSLIYTIGWVGSALAPVLAPTNLWTNPPAAKTNQVRIFAGLAKTGDEARSTGGDAPDVVLWDSNGTYISYDLAKTWAGYRSHIGNGHTRDYTVPNENGRAAGPAEYISLVGGGKNSLCLAAVSVRTPDADGLTWTGDIGYTCGLPWYAQQSTISSSNHRTKCVWIDDGGNPGGHTWNGLSIHLPSFTVQGQQNAQNLASQWNNNTELVCQSAARWSMYHKIDLPNKIEVFTQKLQRASDGTDDDQQILNEANWKRAEEPFDALAHCPLVADQIGSKSDSCWPKGPSAKERMPRQTESKRSLAERQTTMSNEIVISSLEGNDVFDLCHSDTSLGPDYVSLTEDTFCDMSTKTLWPLCSNTVTENCFDVNEMKMLWGAGELRKRDQANTSYKVVRRWDSK